MRTPDTRSVLFSTMALLTIAVAPLAIAQELTQGSRGHSQIVLLGTGTPSPDPNRSGPATAIIVNDTAYLIDAGPGIVRRAAAAGRDREIAALQVTKLHLLFVTHLHSDHTLGLPDLMFSPWTVGRRVPLDVFGPSGIKEMADHLIQAYHADIETRTNPDGNQRDFPQGYKVNAHEVRAGTVYKDENVTVSAFPTKHAMESYGYRFDTPDRSIVVSGYTNPTQATIDACRGCDVLIHEVNSIEWLKTRPASFQVFAAKFHTTTAQLAELASRAKPGLLILDHIQAASPEHALNEMTGRYSGRVVAGHDLDVY